MKKLALLATSSLAVAALSLAVASCNNGGDADSASSNVATDSTGAPIAPSALNIRYIDGDSISEHYDFAKDLKQQSVEAFSRLDSEQQKRAQQMQSFAAQIENKAQTNQYLSQESYNADMAKLAKMQQDAESYLASLQHQTEQTLTEQQMALNDSLNSFLQDYNKQHGYDAILYKAAGAYFNPALDITNEVIEGLNARYKKPEGTQK